MQERHVDGERYFKELAYSTEKYLLPFMEGVRKVVPGMKVLEIGCGVGGNLLPFVERGCRVTGVDLGKERIAQAARLLDPVRYPGVELIAADIFTVAHLKGSFDLILVHDVIEHIPDKVRFFELIKEFLRPGGIIFWVFLPGICLSEGINRFVKVVFCPICHFSIYFRVFCIKVY